MLLSSYLIRVTQDTTSEAAASVVYQSVDEEIIASGAVL